MNQKQWNIGAIALVLMILCIAGFILVLNKLKAGPGSVGQRDPLPAFGYCDSKQARPCVLSFNLDKDGNMVINVLTNSLQNFYIKIRHETGERIYECERAGEYSVRVACTGEAMPAGEMLNFMVISTGKNTTLAQGNFSIIGMALATPEVSMTPTPILQHAPR